MEPGRFYLISCPWFWTVIGRYVKHANFQEIVLDDMIYFTRTGVTFDKLTKDGLASNSVWHGPSNGVLVPAQGMKWPWLAPTPWAQKK